MITPSPSRRYTQLSIVPRMRRMALLSSILAMTPTSFHQRRALVAPDASGLPGEVCSERFRLVDQQRGDRAIPTCHFDEPGVHMFCCFVLGTCPTGHAKGLAFVVFG